MADFLTAFFAVAIALVLVSSLVHALNRLKAANCRGGTDDYREYPEERSAPAVEPAPPAVVLPVVEERRQRVLAELVGTFAAGRVTQLLEKASLLASGSGSSNNGVRRSAISPQDPPT